MVLNALFITGMGMGGVFAFLLLLIIGMAGLRKIVEKTGRTGRDKVAVALAIVCSRGK